MTPLIHSVEEHDKLWRKFKEGGGDAEELIDGSVLFYYNGNIRHRESTFPRELLYVFIENLMQQPRKWVLT